MAPPAVADVGGRRREFGLERQGRPRDDRVPREPDCVSVTARAGVAGEGHAGSAVAGRVEVMEVVQQPERVDPWQVRTATLLPVDPPEVHALGLEWVVQRLEVRAEEDR